MISSAFINKILSQTPDIFYYDVIFNYIYKQKENVGLIDGTKNYIAISIFIFYFV